RLSGGRGGVLRAPPSRDSGLAPGRYVLNQNELLTSQTVLGRAVRLAGSRTSVERLENHLKTETATDPDLVTITGTDPSASEASRLADAITRSYEEVIDEQSRAQISQL